MLLMPVPVPAMDKMLPGLVLDWVGLEEEPAMLEDM